MSDQFKFSANINLMFTEIPNLIDRIAAAKEAGFVAIESTMPFTEDAEKLGSKLKRLGMKCTLINSHPGDKSKGDKGLACRPDRTDDFVISLDLTIKYAKAMGCNRVHLLSGLIKDGDSIDELENYCVSSMKMAADRLKQENINLLIESVNSKYLIPNYLIDTPEKALEIVKKVNKPNCRFQMDIFHMQIICGDLTNNIKKYMEYTDYIQISQVPDRGDPFSEGEINYHYILPLIKKLGYNDYIGLEYKPTGSTKDSIKWISKWRM